MKALTIAIPTFNRMAALSSSLRFLLEETEAHHDDVDLIVIDNHSLDDTWLVLQELRHGTRGRLKVFQQPENVGLVRNAYSCLSHSGSLYTWIVGDDDTVYPGSVSKILANIRSRNAGLFHSNFGVKDGRTGDVLSDTFYGFDLLRLPADDYNTFKHIYCTDTSGLMFLTANVYNTELANEAVSLLQREPDSLAFTLFLAMYCARKGGGFFEKTSLVMSTFFSVSWASESDRLHYYLVPVMHDRIRKLGFTTREYLKANRRVFRSALTRHCLAYRIRHPGQSAHLLALLMKNVLSPGPFC